MHISCCRLTFPVKVAVPCSLIVLFILYYIDYQAFVIKLRGATLQLFVLSPNPDCPPGFYAEEELKPHIQRPLQDPTAPGADGKAFEPHPLTAKEGKEFSEGIIKNQFNQFASDRVSLHRLLGKDTRHPEWVYPLFY